MQQLLAWVNKKTSDISSSIYSTTAVRAFYLCLAVGVYAIDNSNAPFCAYWNIDEISDLLETIEPNLSLSFDIAYGELLVFGNFKSSIGDENLALDFHLSHARCHLSLLGRTAKGVRESDVGSIVLYFDDSEDDEFESIEQDHP